MTAAPAIKGWCPGALRPMQSGDGWLVRIRPPGGTLTPAQAKAIAEAAARHGNGTLDLSARANLQLRGVTEASHAPLIEDLRAHHLIDPDIETESLRNLIVTPFRTSPPTPALPHKGGREALAPDLSAPTPPDTARDGDTRHLPSPRWEGVGGAARPDDSIARLAATLTAALAHMPHLPGKFGFAIDAGPRPVLTAASADLRLERAADGRLILRPDGHRLGKPVTNLAEDAIALAKWFVASGGITNGRGRMAALIAQGIIPEGCTAAPAEPLPQPEPGLYPDGALIALAFGQIRAETLSALAALGYDVRPTPWRMLLLAGATRLPAIPGLITDRSDPLLRVTACTGSPGCPQGQGETRRLARALAARLPEGKHLHLSGCTKGCAHPMPADLTLVASPQGYDLVRNGTASDAPTLRGLTPEAIPDHLKAPNAPPL